MLYFLKQKKRKRKLKSWATICWHCKMHFFCCFVLFVIGAKESQLVKLDRWWKWHPYIVQSQMFDNFITRDDIVSWIWCPRVWLNGILSIHFERDCIAKEKNQGLKSVFITNEWVSPLEKNKTNETLFLFNYYN